MEICFCRLQYHLFRSVSVYRSAIQYARRVLCYAYVQTFLMMFDYFVGFSFPYARTYSAFILSLLYFRTWNALPWLLPLTHKMVLQPYSNMWGHIQNINWQQTEYLNVFACIDNNNNNADNIKIVKKIKIIIISRKCPYLPVPSSTRMVVICNNIIYTAVPNAILRCAILTKVPILCCFTITSIPAVRCMNNVAQHEEIRQIWCSPSHFA